MKRNIVEEITGRILEDLEKGVMPWEEPLKAGGRRGFPFNASTKKAYRGINTFILWNEAKRKGFSNPSWLTFNQAKQLGGSVKKGEKGTNVVFYKRLSKTKSLDLEDEVVLEEQAFWVLRKYTVFNLDQVEGLDHLKPKAEMVELSRAMEEADKLLKGSGAVIFHREIQWAFYRKEEDYIALPYRESFKTPQGYYMSGLHELTHWTGHPSRLNRETGKRFGDNAYAFEELIAEMGAAFLCASVGMAYNTQHATYIESWGKVLKDHKKAIFTAAAKAQAAMDFLLTTETKPETPVVVSDEAA